MGAISMPWRLLNVFEKLSEKTRNDRADQKYNRRAEDRISEKDRSELTKELDEEFDELLTEVKRFKEN